jgi:hypothetical protein
MTARIHFLCPTCKAVMDAPVEMADRKINCLKCGQRLQIPPGERARTILATGLGVREDDASPPATNDPVIPMAQIAPALPTPIPPAAPAPLPGEPGHAADAISRSPSQAVGMFLKWIWRDRRFRLVSAMSAVLLACFFFCTCGGVGVRYVATNGALPFVRPDIVGTWEPSVVVMGMTVEFKRNGTGEVVITQPKLDFDAQNKFAWIAGEKAMIDFKWHVEGLKKPVLVIDITDSKFFKKQGFQNWLSRFHCNYTLEDGTLTISALEQPAQMIALRRAKPSAILLDSKKGGV